VGERGLFARAQKFVTMTYSSLVLLIEVVVAAVSSALILGEQFVPGSALGALLVCTLVTSRVACPSTL